LSLKKQIPLIGLSAFTVSCPEDQFNDTLALYGDVECQIRMLAGLSVVASSSLPHALLVVDHKKVIHGLPSSLRDCKQWKFWEK
jgi:hypothetical protein